MNETIEFLIRHGAAVLFVATFVEQIGVPVPAVPWLLAAGSLAGTGEMNWLTPFIAAVMGSEVAAMIGFQLGRRRGQRMVKLLCRFSLEPDTCVRKTQGFFTRHGMRGIVLAKLLPGLATLSPPLAGNSGINVLRFLFFDTLGALLYVGSFVLVGVTFCHQLEQVISALSGLGRGAGVVLGGMAALYIGYKYYKRRRLLKELQMARITVDELHRKQEAGESLMILDLRSVDALKEDPALIPGALHMTLEEVESRAQEIPSDRDIIMYCSCPNEVSAAKAALLLHKKGILRVRPLLGGIDAWRERHYPMDVHYAVVAEK